MHRSSLLLLSAAILVLTAGAPTTAARPDRTAEPAATTAAAIIVPRTLDLGTAAPGAVTRGHAWLVNPTDRPLTVRGARGTCGCIELIDFEPTTLAPHHALEVPLTMRAPARDGVAKTKAIVFAIDGHAPLTLPVSIRAGDVDSTPPAVLDVGRLLAVPAHVDLGLVERGDTATAEVWLINTASQRVTLSGATTSCGCTTLADVAGRALAAGEALRLPIAMRAPNKVGAEKRTTVTLTLDGQEPVRVALELSTPEA